METVYIRFDDIHTSHYRTLANLDRQRYLLALLLWYLIRLHPISTHRGALLFRYYNTILVSIIVHMISSYWTNQSLKVKERRPQLQSKSALSSMNADMLYCSECELQANRRIFYKSFFSWHAEQWLLHKYNTSSIKSTSIKLSCLDLGRLWPWSPPPKRFLHHFHVKLAYYAVPPGGIRISG